MRARQLQERFPYSSSLADQRIRRRRIEELAVALMQDGEFGERGKFFPSCEASGRT